MSGPTVYKGRVLQGGLLVLDRPRDYGRELRALAGAYVEVLVRKQRQQRSPQSNRYYWGHVLAEIAAAAGYTKDEAHDALKYEFLCEDGDGPLVKVKSTADLSVEEFAEYLERCMVLGATTFGIVRDDRRAWEAA